LSAWTALRRERARDQAGDTFQSGEFAGLFDFALSDRTRLRLNLELARGFGDGQAGWPAFTSLPSRFNRRITTAQRGWAGYRVNSDSALLAIEHAVSDRTLVRLGHSIIRYKGSWTDLFLDPVAGPGAGSVPQYTLTGFVNRDQDFASNAWHGDITTRWQWAGAQHRSIAALTQIDTNEPDRLWPGQTVGLWTLGTQLPAIALLPATAQRRLVSNETRLTLRNTAQWKAFEVGLGLQIAKFEDATRDFVGPGAALGQVSRTLVLPAITARYAVSESVSVVATHSRGGTGRQFASINSTTPGQILPAVVSEESELGARWSHGPWSIGMALFQISRPYRFEQQNISVWRGLQAHEGVEATVQWRSEDELTSVAFTAQSLRASIQGTGDPTLDGKLPPGLPRHRATWFAEHRLGKDSDWTLNFAGEARSKAATFDDNQVYADGFVRLDAGLLWRISSMKRSPTLQLNVENLTNRFAWADIGGGIVFPLPRRRVFITLTVPLQ
jgi:outer membrane receptor for monomeric catechols